MNDQTDLDPLTSAALDAWAGGATTELLERSMIVADASGRFDGPTPAMTRAARRPRRRRLAVSVGVAAAIAAAALIVGLVVAPKSSTVRLKPAGDLPSQSNKPGRGENVATAYVEPAWWPSTLHSPIEARGIGSFHDDATWLIRRDDRVVAIASVDESDAQPGDDPSGQTVVVNPSDGAEASVTRQLDSHQRLSVSSEQLSATDLNSVAAAYDPASRSFAGGMPAGLVAAVERDGWLATFATGNIGFTADVVRWSGRADDDRQLGVGGRLVGDAHALVTAIGQYNLKTTTTKVGSTPAVLVPAVDGHVHLYWAISPTVLGSVNAKSTSTADVLHAARSTAIVPRSWWQQVSHRKRVKRTVHGFRIADTVAYVASGSLGTYRWFMTRGVDGLFLTYTDGVGHFVEGEGRFDGPEQLQVQPPGTLSLGGGGPNTEVSLVLPHGAHHVHVTINGMSVPSALFRLPGTEVDKVIAVGKDPSYDPGTTLGTDLTTLPTMPIEHATVTATLPDGSPFSASV
jgi:hypothetical protein